MGDERTSHSIRSDTKMIEVASTIATALVQRDEGVLLLRRAKNFEEVPLGRGFWELPGGKVDDGESLDMALLRELEEEIGLASTLQPQYLGACRYTLEAGTVRAHRTQQVFSLPAPQGWKIRLGDEHDRHMFVRRKAEVEQLVKTAELRDFLRQYLGN